MIFCFPNPVTNSRVLVVLPWIVKFTLVKQVILPCLFSVPSMFRVIIGRLSDWVLSPIVFVKFWSMNFPPAPLSMRPRVSTVWFSSVHLIKMGIDNEFDLIVAKFTEKMSNTGEVNVDAALHFKNPPFRLLGRILLSRLRLTKQ